MAQNNTPVQPPVNQAPTAGRNLIEEIRNRKELLELQKLEREQKAVDDTIAIQAAARESTLTALASATAEAKAKQNSCPHTKPRNLGTALAGQRTGAGYAVYVCQYCGKEFSHPPRKPEEAITNVHLFPPPEFVGGPNF